jgi:hypothetical protein
MIGVFEWLWSIWSSEKIVGFSVKMKSRDRNSDEFVVAQAPEVRIGF